MQKKTDISMATGNVVRKQSKTAGGKGAGHMHTQTYFFFFFFFFLLSAFSGPLRGTIILW